MNEYLSPEICKKCGGKCCKRLPAPYTPKDIIRIFGNVQNAIKSGIVAIDCWDRKLEPLYFIRPKIKGVKKLYHRSWGGECMHFGKNGCNLPREKMPFFCKTLEPKDGEIICDDHLHGHSEKHLAGILWRRSKINLEGLVKEKNEANTTFDFSRLFNMKELELADEDESNG